MLFARVKRVGFKTALDVLSQDSFYEILCEKEHQIKGRGITPRELEEIKVLNLKTLCKRKDEFNLSPQIVQKAEEMIAYADELEIKTKDMPRFIWD